MARLGMSSMATTSEEWIAYCRAAEEAGLHSIWSADAWHRDGFVNAAIALMATREIRVGLAIAMPTRSPQQTAKAAQNLSQLGQRFTLGLGPGHGDHEIDNQVGQEMLRLGGPFTNWHGHGVPYSPAIGRLREYLHCIRSALRAPAGELVEIEGRHFKIGAMGFGLNAEELPIVIGGIGPRMVRLAGAQADGLVTHLLSPRRLIAHRAAEARANRTEPFFLATGCVASVHADEGVALRRATADLVAALHTQHYVDRLGWLAGEELAERVQADLAAGRVEDAARALPEWVVRQFLFVSTPRRFHADVEAFEETEVINPLASGIYFNGLPGLLGTTAEDAADAQRTLVECMFGSALVTA